MDRQRLNRRRLLQIGGLGAFGLNLPALFRAEAATTQRRAAAKVKSCILVFYYGGPSHLDTWDMKPQAPREVRGEFKPVATSVPGITVSEHLPRCARLMHKIAVVRSMHHPMRNHNSAAVESLCGRTPLKGDLELLANDPNSFPCYGSTLSYLTPGATAIPPHVALPHVMYNVVELPGQNAGFLGSGHNPLTLSCNPNADDYRVQEFSLPADLPLQRLEDRRSLWRLLNHQIHAAERQAGRVDGYHQRAFNLLSSDAVRRALDIGQENAKTRERYGRNILGQSVLLARRLVEAGVRFVNVYDKVHNGQDANWDSHEKCFVRHKDHLLPPADQAFSALIEDLEGRGLLDSTLVIGLGEFGRTPKINRNAGRDHWPDCFSVVLAGGGIHGGMHYGSSDKIGAYPKDDPVTPGDLAATLFWSFGLDTQKEIRDITGRPYRVADGEPLRRLFSGA